MSLMMDQKMQLALSPSPLFAINVENIHPTLVSNTKKVVTVDRNSSGMQFVPLWFADKKIPNPYWETKSSR